MQDEKPLIFLENFRGFCFSRHSFAQKLPSARWITGSLPPSSNVSRLFLTRRNAFPTAKLRSEKPPQVDQADTGNAPAQQYASSDPLGYHFIR